MTNSSPDLIRFGKWVRQVRSTAGISRQYYSRQILHINVDTLDKIEAGERKLTPPQMRLFKTFARSINIKQKLPEKVTPCNIPIDAMKKCYHLQCYWHPSKLCILAEKTNAGTFRFPGRYVQTQHGTG